MYSNLNTSFVPTFIVTHTSEALSYASYYVIKCGKIALLLLLLCTLRRNNHALFDIIHSVLVESLDSKIDIQRNGDYRYLKKKIFLQYVYIVIELKTTAECISAGYSFTRCSVWIVIII